MDANATDDFDMITRHQNAMREEELQKRILIDFALSKSRNSRCIGFRVEPVHHRSGDRASVSIISRREAKKVLSYVLDRRQVEKLAEALREVATDMDYDDPNDPAWSDDLCAEPENEPIDSQEPG